jgi:hypothetical protein
MKASEMSTIAAIQQSIMKYIPHSFPAARPR